MNITKKIIKGRIFSEINESDVAYVNHLSENEINELSDLLTDSLSDLLLTYQESSEGLINVNNDNSVMVINIEKLK